MFGRKVTCDLLKKVRSLMQEKLVDAYLVPMSDVHNNEYLAACDKKVAYISGFTGSAGVAVITRNKAALWTDARYFEQAENQIDENWTLMRYGQPNTLSPADLINREIDTQGKVGCYKYQVSMNFYQQVLKALQPHRSIELLDECLVSNVWTDRPLRSSNPIIILPDSFTGKSWHCKVDEVRQKMKDQGVTGLFLSLLDEIAWLFNLRGSDITHNPVFFSFCYVDESEIHLFLDRDKMRISPGLSHFLSDDDTCKNSRYKIQVNDYLEVRNHLAKINERQQKVWLDPRTACGFVFALSEYNRHLVRSPISMMKAVKTKEEISGMKKCAIEDSVALCQFFCWLEKAVAAGVRITEAEAADELDRLRSLLPGFVSASFDTISCSGRNGGLVHYRAVHGRDAVLADREVYLCDSGGQYLTGTTDVTRTVHFGHPSAAEKHAYTCVLKGHIALAALVFPSGTPGSKLEAIPRTSLWRYGMDYQHGTGHGVGAFLSVHEGPYGLSAARSGEDEPGLLENMVLTIEPGVYRSQQFGIRIENDYFLARATLGGALSTDYLRFEPLTFFPIQARLIDTALMAASEMEWINEYHLRCRERLSAVLRARGLDEESLWLERETAPIHPSS